MVRNKICFGTEEFGNLVTWAIYFRCWPRQNLLIGSDLVIFKILSFVNLNLQSISSSSAFSVGSDWLERLARERVRLLDGGAFSLSKPFLTRRRRKFIHMDSNLVVSIALSIPACTLYVKRLLTQAERNFIRVVKNTLLSVSTCFRSFHFAYADATRWDMKAECSDWSLDRVCPRYVNFPTFSIFPSWREDKEGC